MHARMSQWRARASSLHTERNRTRLVRLLWLYFALLIVEGALRKWVFPELSDVLLVARDPVAAVILLLAIRDGYLPNVSLTRMLAWLLPLFAVLGVLQVVTQGLPLPVFAFGLRTYFLHPPLIFVMALVLTPRDVRQVVLVTLVAAIPIAWLMTQQFNADRFAWINRGTGEGGLQIVSSMGRIRPAGPFSYISGPVFFYVMTMACLVASHLRGMRVPLLLQACGWGTLVVAAAVSGSRSLIAGLIPVGLAVVFALLKRPGLMGPLAKATIVAAGVTMLVLGFTVVQDGLEVLDSRIVESGGTREIAQRSSDLYVMTQTAWFEAPLMGRGIGFGTNTANAFVGARVFRFGETEWARILFEAGPILGGAYLFWRAWLALRLLRAASSAVSAREVLPLLLVAGALSNLVLGPWGQPTTQGFAVWTSGLAFAACRASRNERSASRARRRHTPASASAMARPPSVTSVSKS